MRANTAILDFSKIMMVMLMTAGLVFGAVVSSSAGDRDRRVRTVVFKDASWRHAKRVNVVKTVSPGRHHRDVKVIRHLPRGHKRVKFGHRHYYNHGGRYYEKRARGFVSVAPPYGAWFLSLPLGSVRLAIGGNTYFRHHDTYYRRGSRGYVVTAPPRPVYWRPWHPGPAW